MVWLGVSADVQTCVGVPAGPTDRLGWNAIPLALEDLDSNYATGDG